MAAPADLPLEQTMALAQFPAEGILEADLPRRLGMTPSEASHLRGALLRRRLIVRQPAGRPRAHSQLLLTERGRQAKHWLAQLQTTLSPTVFDPGTALLSPDATALETPLAIAASTKVSHRRWGWRRTAESQEAPRPRVEEGIFEQGMLNVWLGTGFFAGAVLVGVLMQTERAALVALGLGCLLATIFFARAGVVALRRLRSQREPGRGHGLWPHGRRPSGGAVH
ncbi:MAG TPA: hypothetical protein VI138_06465 [Candidatus Dormibacteraeota bacterium]